MTLTRTLGVQCCAASRQTNMCILSCMWTRNHSCPMYTFPDQWQRWPPTMKLTPMVAPAAYTLRQVFVSLYIPGLRANTSGKTTRRANAGYGKGTDTATTKPRCDCGSTAVVFSLQRGEASSGPLGLRRDRYCSQGAASLVDRRVPSSVFSSPPLVGRHQRCSAAREDLQLWRE